jgi:hypothetical protein
MIKRFKPTAGFIIVILIVLGMLIIGITIYRNELKMHERSNIDMAHLPEAEKLTHSDSLPYYQYKLVADSLKNIADNEKDKNTLHPSGFSAGIGFLGFVQTFRAWYGWYTDHKSYLVSDYYIWLPSYTLDDRFEFYYKDGKNYLKEINGHSKEIKVAYLKDFEKSVLVPVSKEFFTGGRLFIFILMALIGFALLYIFIALPINVLFNISRGKVFTQINLRDLHVLAYTSLGFFLVQMIMPYVTSLFFLKKIPPELTLSFSSLFNSSWEIGLFGIITLTIARAFAKGYKLQQEQDLTI